ncbi:MAG TPA: urease accessory protein UreE [Stellaceae bacterium]|nr:urease accessory protein UreE [Stellaceae bacterium]
MLRAIRIEPSGHWPRDQAQDSVTLDHDARYRRRARLATDRGVAFLLDLPHAMAMGEGDGLALEDGSWIAVRAKAEPLIEVTGPAALLCRIAWHIGNRHVPAAIEPQRILIRDDHVLADMLRLQGASLRRVCEPFAPERGAYESHDHHVHHHDH